MNYYTPILVLYVLLLVLLSTTIDFVYAANELLHPHTGVICTIKHLFPIGLFNFNYHYKAKNVFLSVVCKDENLQNICIQVVLLNRSQF